MLCQGLLESIIERLCTMFSFVKYFLIIWFSYLLSFLVFDIFSFMQYVFDKLCAFKQYGVHVSVATSRCQKLLLFSKTGIKI